jgi:hypothetical protein
MRLDLDKDKPVLARRLAEGVAAFAAASPPPLPLPVTRIDIQYDLTTMAEPCVWAYLDTEPGGEPDSGTSARWKLLEQWCPHWGPACQAACAGRAVAVRGGGREVQVEDEDGLNRAAGQFFIGLLKELRDFGTFNELPRAANCYLGVSTTGGGFGWPAWEERGPNNMV